MARKLLCVLFSLGALALMESPVEAKQKPKPVAKSRFRDRPAPSAQPTIRGHGERRVREEGQTVIYKKRTEVDFDDSLIEGEVRNPSEFYFVHRPEQKYPGLVKKRPNFHKEMLRDTVMIR